jgi:homoserine O-succinyltransferase
MPVCLNGNPQNHDLPAGIAFLAGRSTNGHQGRAAGCVNIGLINNMPDAALEATERQFIKLLEAAADGVLVRLSFYALPDVPRRDWGRQRVKRLYSGIENLWSSQLDGLIVTGREPQTPDLKDEPYWSSLTRVLEWAEDNTLSTVWSCLAAHAALLHMDGIARRRSKEKRCGVFDCVRLSDHPLLAGLSSCLRVPHSRWNDLLEDELMAAGYSVLTRAQDAGADMIVRRRNSLFAFFQGHPEYESDTLLLEYRRDVRRYLAGETGTYPLTPQSYFDNSIAETLTALREKALLGHREGLLADVTAAVDGKTMAHPWRSTAARVYSNWLAYICAQKEARLGEGMAATNAHG